MFPMPAQDRQSSPLLTSSSLVSAKKTEVASIAIYIYHPNPHTLHYQTSTIDQQRSFISSQISYSSRYPSTRTSLSS